MIRKRQRLKRERHSQLQSLDATVSAAHGSPTSRSNSISEEDNTRRTGAILGDPLLRWDDDGAFQWAMSEMPRDVRMLCRQIMGGSVQPRRGNRTSPGGKSESNLIMLGPISSALASMRCNARTDRLRTAYVSGSGPVRSCAVRRCS